MNIRNMNYILYRVLDVKKKKKKRLPREPNSREKNQRRERSQHQIPSMSSVKLFQVHLTPILDLPELRSLQSHVTGCYNFSLSCSEINHDEVVLEACYRAVKFCLKNADLPILTSTFYRYKI